MKFATVTFALLASSATVQATLCGVSSQLGLPDPLHLCSDSSSTTTAAVHTTPTTTAKQTTSTTTTSTKKTTSAANVYDYPEAPPVSTSHGPSTTLTIASPSWSSTTTSYSVVIVAASAAPSTIVTSVYDLSSTTSSTTSTSVPVLSSTSVKPTAPRVTTNAAGVSSAQLSLLVGVVGLLGAMMA